MDWIISPGGGGGYPWLLAIMARQNVFTQRSLCLRGGGGNGGGRRLSSCPTGVAAQEGLVGHRMIQIQIQMALLTFLSIRIINAPGYGALI